MKLIQIIETGELCCSEYTKLQLHRYWNARCYADQVGYCQFNGFYNYLEEYTTYGLDIHLTSIYEIRISRNWKYDRRGKPISQPIC